MEKQSGLVRVGGSERAAEQFDGREGETATLLSTGLSTLSLRVGGFAPRHLKRWASSLLLLGGT